MVKKTKKAHFQEEVKATEENVDKLNPALKNNASKSIAGSHYISNKEALWNFYGTIKTKQPSSHWSMPAIVSTVEKRQWRNVRKAFHLCTEGTYDKYKAVMPLVKALLIPRGHIAHVLLRKYDVHILGKIIWMLHPATTMNELGMDLERKKIWKGAEGELNTGLPMTRRAKKRQTRATLTISCYKILQICWYQLKRCRGKRWSRQTSWHEEKRFAWLCDV